MHNRGLYATVEQIVATPELCFIVPCFNKRPNVRPLIAQSGVALARIPQRMMYIDDNSPDGTADEVRCFGGEVSRVRCVRGVGRGVVALAVIEGAPSPSA
jgi:dolichol-phosphate mannosyltransferase